MLLYGYIQGVYSLLPNPYSHMKCLFIKIQSNIAIWQYIAIHSNTIRNTTLIHIVSPLIHRTQNIECFVIRCILCQLGPFFAGPVTFFITQRGSVIRCLAFVILLGERGKVKA